MVIPSYGALLALAAMMNVSATMESKTGQAVLLRREVSAPRAAHPVLSQAEDAKQDKVHKQAESEQHNAKFEREAKWAKKLQGRSKSVIPLSASKLCQSIIPPSAKEYNLSHPDAKGYSQIGQDVLLEKVLGSITGGFFVESGAADGELNSNTLFYEKKGWQGLLVEPYPSTFKTLLSRNRKAHAFNGGLSTTGKIGMMGLHIEDCAGYDGDGECSTMDSSSAGTSTVQVPVAPTERLLECLGRKTVDFWSLDVEGVESKVLESFPFDKIEVGLMLIEMNKGVSNNKGIATTLEKHNFKEVGSTSLDRIYANSQYFAARGLKVPDFT